MKTLAHAFIMSRVDYWNSVLASVIEEGHWWVAASVEYAAARLISNTGNYTIVDCHSYFTMICTG